MNKLENFEISGELEEAVVLLSYLSLLFARKYMDVSKLCNVSVCGGESNGFVAFNISSSVLATGIEVKCLLDKDNECLQPAVDSYNAVVDMLKERDTDLFAVEMVCSIKDIDNGIRVACGQVSLYERS